MDEKLEDSELDKYELMTLRSLAKWQSDGDHPYSENADHYNWLGCCINSLNRIARKGFLRLVDGYFIVTDAGFSAVRADGKSGQ